MTIIHVKHQPVFKNWRILSSCHCWQQCIRLGRSQSSP